MKKNNRSHNMTIRVDDLLLKSLDRLSDKYKCSDSDIIHACVLYFNDCDLIESQKEKCKYILRYLKDMRKNKYDI